jgi:HSP20 family molecular chaperone IbpA
MYYTISNFYDSVSVEEKDKKQIISLPATGLKPEDIKVSFKGETCTILLKESPFNVETSLTYIIGFKPDKECIKVYTQNGVLFVEIEYPKDYEFEITVWE